MPSHYGARRGFAPRNQYEDMGLWAQDPNAGQAPAVSNNDFWGSGPGGMPVDNPGFGAAPFVSNMNYNTTPSSVALALGNPSGTNSFVDSMNRMNLGQGRFGGLGFTQDQANRFYAKPPGDPNQTTQPWGGGIMKSLGGLGGLANIGMTGWGLYQQGQQIDDLRDWRAKLNERADASLAMDKEKFGLVKQEYDTRRIKRKADMWKQRDPNLRDNPTDNPYMNQLLTQEA